MGEAALADPAVRRSMHVIVDPPSTPCTTTITAAAAAVNLVVRPRATSRGPTFARPLLHARYTRYTPPLSQPQLTFSMADELPASVVERKLMTVRSRSSSSGRYTTPTRPTRPGHLRSQSYLSPINSNSNSAATLTVENAEKPIEPSRFHRLHLPGRHRHTASKDESKAAGRLQGAAKHKYTQSESQQPQHHHHHHHHHKKKDSTHLNGETSHLPASNTLYPVSTNSERPNEHLYPGSRNHAIHSLKRIASNRSARGGNAILERVPTRGAGIDQRPGQRRRASSDPRSPTYEGNGGQQLRPASRKTSIELLLDRADHLRQLRRQNVTDSSIQQTTAHLDLASEELTSHASTATRSAADLMRHLDETQDILFRTTESLVDTISSFSNLSTQSSALLTNFMHESGHVSFDTRSGIAKDHHAICVTRGRRVDVLETRGHAVSHRAAELGERLESCRTALKSWEEREENRRKAWRGVIFGVLWGALLILVAAFVGIVSWKIMAGHHRLDGTLDQRLNEWATHNRTHDWDEKQPEKLNVPADVLEILLDINARAAHGQSLAQSKCSSSCPATASDSVNLEDKISGRKKEHRGFRLLDEL